MIKYIRILKILLKFDGFSVSYEASYEDVTRTDFSH